LTAPTDRQGLATIVALQYPLAQEATRIMKPRTAIVTGSTSGIGLAIARAFAAEGCRLVLNSFTDREEDRKLAAVLAEEFQVDAAYVKADMARGEECRALVEEAARRFGSVDILVNNAGIQHVAPVEAFPPEKWDAIMAVNLSSAFHTIAAAIPHMKSQGGGRIVNIASAHGLRASPFKSAYVAAKHGIVGLTKTVALELAEERITCDLPGLCVDAFGGGADPRPDGGTWHGP